MVEPIVYGMQVAIHEFGDEMEAFIEHALAAGDPALLLRLQTAASSLEDIVDSETRERAQKMNERLSHALGEVIDAIHGNGDSEIEDT